MLYQCFQFQSVSGGNKTKERRKTCLFFPCTNSKENRRILSNEDSKRRNDGQRKRARIRIYKNESFRLFLSLSVSLLCSFRSPLLSKRSARTWLVRRTANEPGIQLNSCH